MPTNENKLTRASVSLLPMEDIQNQLRYKYDFISKGDNATDTNSVGGVEAGLIAIAVSNDDRETVRNALKLGGLEADKYLTVKDGGNIQNNYDSIKTIYSNEIRLLRDELYQIRGELVRKGIVTDYQSYSGFQDTFKSSDILYENKPVGAIIDSSTKANEMRVDAATFESLGVGDFIALHFKTNDRYHVAQITDKLADGETVEFSPSSPYNVETTTSIYKTLGIYHNGTFSFLEPAKDRPTTAANHSSLDDDTYKIRKHVKTPNSGYGYTFKINDNMFDVDGVYHDSGYLCELKLKATKYGAPSALTAYIIDERDVVNFRNPEQAESDGIIKAKSQPATIDEEQIEKVVTFNFHDGNDYPILHNVDPNTSEKVRFCMIIEAGEVLDDANYYRFLFLQNKTAGGVLGDLQLNNVVYEYTRSGDDGRAMITNSSVNNSDLFYSIVTRGIVSDGISPHKEGIYTKVHKLESPVTVSRARLTLRINREGYYRTGNSGAFVARDGDSVPITKDPVNGKNYDMLALGGIGAKNYDDLVVIGNNIRKLESQSPDAVRVDKGVYIEDAEDVYRVGYKVYLKATLREFNESTFVNEVKDSMKIELPLSAVMGDRKKRSDKVSDRLIFENEFYKLEDNASTSARYFNEFELQIYWKTEYGDSFKDEAYINDFYGAIHDLTLSFDKSL